MASGFLFRPITAPAKPKTFLREGTIEAVPNILGLYRGLVDFAELRHLWLHGLNPDERGWDHLRWGFPPRRSSAVDRMRFFRNPTVPVTQKQQLLSPLMSGQYEIELDPDANPYDVVLAKGGKKGLRHEFESLMMLDPTVISTFEEQRVSIGLVEQLPETLVRRLDG